MDDKIKFKSQKDGFSRSDFVEPSGKIKDESEIPVCWKSYTPPKSKRRKKSK